jgi:hypothetical protein
VQSVQTKTRDNVEQALRAWLSKVSPESHLRYAAMEMTKAFSERFTHKLATGEIEGLSHIRNNITAQVGSLCVCRR